MKGQLKAIHMKRRYSSPLIQYENNKTGSWIHVNNVKKCFIPYRIVEKIIRAKEYEKMEKRDFKRGSLL